MAINAGITIDSSSTIQPTWVSPNWTNISVTVKYPPGQNRTSNPISISDIIVDQLGQVWEVAASTAVTGQNKFIISIKYMDSTPNEAITPDIGGTSFGSIVTPVNGKIAPYWDATYVSDAVYRKAVAYHIGKLETAPSVITQIQQTIQNLDINAISQIQANYNSVFTSLLNIQTDITDIQSSIGDGGQTINGITPYLVTVTSWAGANITLPQGWSGVKVYSNSAYQINHNLGKHPVYGTIINIESDPKIFVPSSNTRSLQIIDNNSCVFTQCVVSDRFTFILFF